MNRRPIPTPARRPRLGGFTLLEIMVVVVLIGILSLLLLGGIKYLSLNAKRQQTRVMLAQCMAMYTDWKATTRYTFPTSTMPAPGNMTVDMQGAGDRFGPAVWFTRDVMFHLRQTTPNQTAIGKITPSALLPFPATQGLPFATGYTPTAWSAINAYTPFETGDYGRVYIVPDPVNYPNTYAYYDCIQYIPAPTGGGSNPSPAQDPTHWLAAYPVLINSGANASPDSPVVPVPLDGWGNPIIFVPGGSLGTAGKPVTTGSGTSTTAVPTVNSPNGLPFFASAGPDGDLSKGDDNMYSFESN